MPTPTAEAPLAMRGGGIDMAELPLFLAGETEDCAKRFWSKVLKTDGCWSWTASRDRGYGRFWVGKKLFWVHRLSHEVFKGPIPAGLQIDHLCRNRSCVNPDHLEAVTARVNTLRSGSTSAVNARKVACIRNHGFTAENTYVWAKDGTRRCRTCDKEREKRRVRDRSKLPGRRR